MAMEIGRKDYKLSCELLGHGDEVRRICVCGGLGIATASMDGTVRLWSADGSENHKYDVTKVMVGHTGVVGSVAWIPPCEVLPQGGVVSGSTDMKVMVWDLNTGNRAATLSGHWSQVTCLALDGDAIVSSSFDGTLRRWTMNEPGESWEAHDLAVYAVIKLPSGELVTGSSDNTMKLWKGKKCLRTFFGHSGTVSGLAYTHEQRILSASHDGSIKLWDLTGKQLMEMVGHTSIVHSVDSHKSGLIVSSSRDCTVKIWKDGVCIQTIKHPGCVWDAKFLVNGDIVTACRDNVVRIWTEQSRIADQLSQYDLSSFFIGRDPNYDVEAQHPSFLTLPGSSHEHPATPATPTTPSMWTVIKATGELEISKLHNDDIIKECTLGHLEKQILEDGMLQHPSYILTRSDHNTLILPNILCFIKQKEAYVRILDGDNDLVKTLKDVADCWRAFEIVNQANRPRFDLFVMEFVFYHTMTRIEEKKANFEQVAMNGPVPVTLWAKISKYFHEEKNDMKCMNDLKHLIREINYMKEAAGKCWSLFDLEDRKSSYVPYTISKLEDMSRILSDRLEEYETKLHLRSAKREIIRSSSSSLSEGLGILTSASVGLKHAAAGKVELAMFVCGCLFLGGVFCGFVSYIVQKIF